MEDKSRDIFRYIDIFREQNGVEPGIELLSNKFHLGEEVLQAFQVVSKGIESIDAEIGSSYEEEIYSSIPDERVNVEEEAVNLNLRYCINT